MAYTLIYGQFVIRYSNHPNNGPRPDGDTIKFTPDDPQLVNDLPRSGKPADLSEDNHISVRLEAIDALELHYSNKNKHQELEGANIARDELLAHLGFENVVFLNALGGIKSANHDEIPGYVLSNGVDDYGRVIGFVYKGSGNRAGNDGSTISVDTTLVDKSVNAKLLADGLVFPAFYGTLPAGLREHLASKSQAARAAKKGIWLRATADSNNGPAKIFNSKSLETLVIWPKLYRRLITFFEQQNEGLEGFDKWLRANDDDDLLRLDTNKRAKLHDILTIEGDSIKLNVQFEKVVIEPKAAS